MHSAQSVVEHGRLRRSNQDIFHGLNGLISKFPFLIISRRDRCEEKHPGHPGGTTEAAVGMGVWR